MFIVQLLTNESQIQILSKAHFLFDSCRIIANFADMQIQNRLLEYMQHVLLFNSLRILNFICVSIQNVKMISNLFSVIFDVNTDQLSI